jgi:serine/threonine-protein kinase RsbW
MRTAFGFGAPVLARQERETAMSERRSNGFTRMTNQFRARFPNTRSAASQARQAVIAHVATYGFASNVLADIETAIGEALANAAEHGHRNDGGFDVRVFIDRDRLIVEVKDDGAGFPTDATRDAPGHGSPRGFGIYLMRHLMDDVSFSERGTCVRLAKRLPPARSEGGNANCG